MPKKTPVIKRLAPEEVIPRKPMRGVQTGTKTHLAVCSNSRA